MPRKLTASHRRTLVRIASTYPVGDAFRRAILVGLSRNANISYGGRYQDNVPGKHVFGRAKVSDDARVYENARVMDNARIYGDAQVFGSAEVHGGAQVFGFAKVHGDARVSDAAAIAGGCTVKGNSHISGQAQVAGHATIEDQAQISGGAKVSGETRIHGSANVYGKTYIYENASVGGNAKVFDGAVVSGDAQIAGNAMIYGIADVHGDARVYGNAKVFGNAHIAKNAQVFGDAQISGHAVIEGDAKIGGTAKISGDAIITGGVWDGSEGPITTGRWNNPQHKRSGSTMTRTLTAADRSALIKLAATLPAGSAERKAILAGIAQPDVTYTVTSEELVRALYSHIPRASVGDAVPPGTQRGISVATGKPVWFYPDPNGSIEATEELTGETFRGYPVRMLTGDEQLKLTVMGEGPRTKIKVEGAPWVVDRFGAILMERDAQRVLKWLGSRGV